MAGQRRYSCIPAGGPAFSRSSRTCTTRWMQSRRAASRQWTSTSIWPSEATLYRLRLARSAQRDLDQLDGILWERIQDALLRLRDEPRPQGCRKLRGGEATYRVRVGDYRVVYIVDDDI